MEEGESPCRLDLGSRVALGFTLMTPSVRLFLLFLSGSELDAVVLEASSAFVDPPPRTPAIEGPRPLGSSAVICDSKGKNRSGH